MKSLTRPGKHTKKLLKMAVVGLPIKKGGFL
jgi:hypothetical protein